jgi:hypothetical protein
MAFAALELYQQHPITIQWPLVNNVTLRLFVSVAVSAGPKVFHVLLIILREHRGIFRACNRGDPKEFAMARDELLGLTRRSIRTGDRYAHRDRMSQQTPRQSFNERRLASPSWRADSEDIRLDRQRRYLDPKTKFNAI